jgi:hypothetical protein
MAAAVKSKLVFSREKMSYAFNSATILGQFSNLPAISKA